MSLKRRSRNALVLVGGSARRLMGARASKRALAFHEVGDIARFRDRLEWLRERYEILGIEDWLDRPVGARTQVTLTFDDGFAFWRESLAGLLEERGIPATFFVSSGLIGLTGQAAETFRAQCLRRRRSLRFLSLEQLRELSKHPLFEIGSHTVHHADLGSITAGDLVRTEIADDRARLEDWIGRPVRWFAYPFGTPESLSPAAREVVEDLAFEAAFSLIPGSWMPRSGDRFAVGRDGLELEYAPAVWTAWLAGGYDELYRVKAGARRLLRSPLRGSRVG